ncbi:MAG: molybdopterin-dependent oxidoreductase [Chloroflexi bacterium]|nr:molybdopterin-dependent oxidoreductase [Chloroflexota bacterium]
MKLTRREFLKLSGITGGTIAASSLLSGGLKTLIAGAKGSLTTVDERTPTTCWIGKQECGLLVRKVNGRVVKIEGHPAHPRNQGTLCPKGISQIMALYDPNRVKTPLLRTNEKGIPGEWEPTTWDEALRIVGERIKDVRARDNDLLVWQKGRSKAGNFYDTAFVKASGATKLHHGGFCSDAGYRACEYTIGLHGVLHPDFRHARYVLSWGWNATNAGGNKLCWLTWPRQLVKAREAGMQMAVIDPRLRGAAHFADDWLPIRPGTDLAMALALCNGLIEEGTVDWDYLRQYTNSPYLVNEEGNFVRDGDTELVWDQASGMAVPHDTPNVDAALEGAFDFDGEQVRPAFQVFKEHIAEYTYEMAEEICGVPAQKIQKVAQDLGENAMIGSSIEVEGSVLPYRPVSIMAYHMAQQELGFQAIRAMLMVTMLLGAVGAVGGQRSDFTWKIHGNYEKLDEIEIGDPPYNIYLKNSQYFPINSNNSSLVSWVQQNPENYGVDTIPEVVILHMVNPLTAFPDQRVMIDTYKKFKFVAAIDPWLSKTADYFADVILPAATLEKYEGPMGVSDQYTDAQSLRVPPVEPLFQSRGEIDIYIDLCEHADILYGEGGYIDQINQAFRFEEDFALPLNSKPATRDIFDRWARSEGIEEGVEFFEQIGLHDKGSVPATSYYGYATDPVFGGAVHRLYGESLLGYQREMRARGVDEIYWQDYTALPTWRKPTMDLSPDDYDLYLISFKMIEFKQSRASQIPLLAELAPQSFLEINPVTARERDINDGDEVWVESHNAVTLETRRVKVTAKYRESIRPDVVGMPHHYGEVARHPWAQGQGPTPNELFFTGEGYVANTADQSFHVKVKVSHV